MKYLLQSIDNFLCWIALRWPGINVALVLFVVGSWGFGYYAEAFFNMKFELASCWVGVGALAAGGLISLGKEAGDWVRYWIDSKHNSKPYEKPCQGSGINDKSSST